MRRNLFALISGALVLAATAWGHGGTFRGPNPVKAGLVSGTCVTSRRYRRVSLCTTIGRGAVRSVLGCVQPPNPSAPEATRELHGPRCNVRCSQRGRALRRRRRLAAFSFSRRARLGLTK